MPMTNAPTAPMEAEFKKMARAQTYDDEVKSLQMICKAEVQEPVKRKDVHISEISTKLVHC